jgi:hypothetical protein
LDGGFGAVFGGDLDVGVLSVAGDGEVEVVADFERLVGSAEIKGERNSASDFFEHICGKISQLPFEPC